MEDLKKKNVVEMNDKEIIFSKSIKAGKRIYYLDVKRNRKDEMFLAITESKKVITGEGENIQVNFEKHKIFLYREDFEKFITGLTQAIGYINDNQEMHYYNNENKLSDTDKVTESLQSEETENIEEGPKNDSEVNNLGGEIKLDIDF